MLGPTGPLAHSITRARAADLFLLHSVRIPLQVYLILNCDRMDNPIAAGRMTYLRRCPQKNDPAASYQILDGFPSLASRFRLSSWCGRGSCTPAPTPNRTCNFSLHPALQTALIAWTDCSTRSSRRRKSFTLASALDSCLSRLLAIFFGPLPHSSRTLSINEPFHDPKRQVLPPFAMWLAFPTSDYYGGSATCLPHR